MRSWKKSSMEMLWIAQIYFLIPQHASCLKQAWVEPVYVFAKKQLNGNNTIVILLESLKLKSETSPETIPSACYTK